jgi:antitoxin StbD
LKRNPAALINEADGEAITVLNHNIPTAYLVPADTFEMLLKQLEDAELASIIVRSRRNEISSAVEVDIDSV